MTPHPLFLEFNYFSAFATAATTPKTKNTIFIFLEKRSIFVGIMCKIHNVIALNECP